MNILFSLEIGILENSPQKFPPFSLSIELWICGSVPIPDVNNGEFNHIAREWLRLEFWLMRSEVSYMESLWKIFLTEENCGGKTLLFLTRYCWISVTSGTSVAILWPRGETLLSCLWNGRLLTFEDIMDLPRNSSPPPLQTYCKIINPYFNFN